MENYLEKYNNDHFDAMIQEMYDYAMDKNVPIVTLEGLRFILQLIKIKKAKNILEVGTAIAFTSIQMALIDKEIHVDTIERKKEMYNLAKENINKFNLDDQINVIFKNALDCTSSDLNRKYDIIFIDAAKAQYIKFFEMFSEYLNPDGIIISDNLLFHGLVSNRDGIESKDLRALVRKIDRYNLWLKNNENFDTVFYNFGDGMAVSMRK